MGIERAAGICLILLGKISETHDCENHYVGYRDDIVPKAVDIAKKVGLKAGNNLPLSQLLTSCLSLVMTHFREYCEGIYNLPGCRRLLQALNLAVYMYLLRLQSHGKVSPPCLLLH